MHKFGLGCWCVNREPGVQPAIDLTTDIISHFGQALSWFHTIQVLTSLLLRESLNAIFIFEFHNSRNTFYSSTGEAFRLLQSFFGGNP